MWEELFLLYCQLLVNCGICLSEKHLCSYSYFLVFQKQKQKIKKEEEEEAQKQKKQMMLSKEKHLENVKHWLKANFEKVILPLFWSNLMGGKLLFVHAPLFLWNVTFL